eukprot:gene4887-5676_t
MTQRNRKLQARIEQQEQGHDGRRRETRPPRALTGCRLLDAGVPARQAERVQTGLLSYRWHAQWRHLLSAPCIYLVAVPPGMRDLFISLCQLQYWCPIQHARHPDGAPPGHAHVCRFVAFGDADAYRQQLEALRQELAEPGKVHHA